LSSTAGRWHAISPSSPPQGTRVPLPKSATPRIAHLREERTSLSRTNRGLYTHKFARPMGSQAHALETIKRPADLGDCNDVMSKSTSKRKIGRPLGGSTTSSTTAVHFGRVSPEKDTFPPPRTFVPCAVCLTTLRIPGEERPSIVRAIVDSNEDHDQGSHDQWVLKPMRSKTTKLQGSRKELRRIQGASSATQAQASSVERQPTRTSSVRTRIVHSGKVQVSPPSPHPRTPRSSSSPT